VNPDQRAPIGALGITVATLSAAGSRRWDLRSKGDSLLFSHRVAADARRRRAREK